MIVTPGGGKLHVRLPKEIPVSWMQVLLDSKVAFANMGIGIQLRCVECLKAGDSQGAFCVGSSNDDGTTFSVDCGCTSRTAIGAFTMPLPPTPPHERELLDPKRVELLPREFIEQMDALDRVIKLLKLQFLMRCLRCQMGGYNDGIYGARESTATLTVLECECTRREYRGPSLGVTH
jgi:hypothetical protein